MRKFFKKLRIILLAVPRVGFELVTWIIPYGRHPERYPLEKRYAKARRLVLFLMRVMRFELISTNPELLRFDTPRIYAGNHVSALDPFILIALSPKPLSFIAKDSLRKTFGVGWFIRAIDGIFLNRDDPFQAMRAFKEAVARMKNSGLSYCVFPEGTRQKDPYGSRPLEFHPGSFKLAQMAHCPIVLFATFGSFHAFDGYLGKSHPMQMDCIELLSEEFVKERKSVGLAEYSYGVIASHVETLIVIDQRYYKQQKNKDKPSPWWLNF